MNSWRYSIYRITVRPDGRWVRQFVGRANIMGEAVRRAHEIDEEAKKERVAAVEVIDRKTAADVPVYRIDGTKGTSYR
jgi:ABC-type Fe3+/spermidine/putrescine transport system ATPase subunit